MRPPQLFTDGDLDGVACAVLFRVRYGETARVTYCNFTKAQEEIREYIDKQLRLDRTGAVMICDTTLAVETAELLDVYAAKGGEVVLLDHHVNGRMGREGEPYSEWLGAKAWARVVEGTCATKLLHSYLGGMDAYEEFVSLVQDYDVDGWANKEQDSQPTLKAKELNRLSYLMSTSEFVKRFTARPQVEFTEGERMLLDMDQRALDNYYKGVKESARIVEVEGCKVALVFSDRYASEIGHKLLDELEVEVVAMLDLQKRRLSLRCGEGVDVGKVALALGGGGHARASGVPKGAAGMAGWFEAIDRLVDGLGQEVGNLTVKLRGLGTDEFTIS